MKKKFRLFCLALLPIFLVGCASLNKNRHRVIDPVPREESPSLSVVVAAQNPEKTEQNSEKVIALEILGELKKGNYREANSKALSWELEHPEAASVHNLRGIALLFLGYYEEAVEEFNITFWNVSDELLLTLLVNKSLAELYQGDLYAFCTTMEKFRNSKLPGRPFLPQERFLYKLSLSLKGKEYQEFLSPEVISLFTGRHDLSLDQQIVKLWVDTQLRKTNQDAKLALLLAKRPVKEILPLTTISSFVIAIIGEKTNPDFLSPVLPKELK